MKLRLTTPLLFLSLILSTSVSAQELLVSEANPKTDHALFGFTVDILYDLTFIGAPQQDVDDIFQVGSVSVYKKSGSEWSILKTLTPPSSEHFLNFGHSISLNMRGTAMIGATGDHQSGLYSGAVYVYENLHSDTSTTPVQKLKASDSEKGIRFGQSIDLLLDPVDAHSAVIGAHQGTGNEEKSGTAYVFEYDNASNTWNEAQKLIASDGKADDYFGHSVKFLNDRLIAVGAYNADGNAERSGVVYIFEKNLENEWVESAKLYDAAGQSSDLFGFSLDATPEIQIVTKQSADFPFNGLLFVGAPGTQNEDKKTGSVFIYSKNLTTGNWEQKLELIEPGSIHNEHFGISVAAGTDQNLYVGASRGNSSSTNQTGNVYKFETNMFYVGEIGSGSEVIEVEQLETLDSFGYQVATQFSDLVIASPHADTETTTNSGKAFFFRLQTVSGEEDAEVVTDYQLFQNYPNPFNPSTAIKYHVKESGAVKLSVFNLLGQEVQVLVNTQQISGSYSVNFDAGNLASGFYFYRLEVNDFVSTRKMMLIK